MVGRGKLRGILRNLKTSPWTRRSLTERFLLDRSAVVDRSDSDKAPKPAGSKSWMSSIPASLRQSRRRKS